MATPASLIDTLIDEPQLCERLGICRTQAWKLRRRPRSPLPFIKLGGAIRYSLPEVEAWLLRQGSGSVRPRPRAARG